MVTFKKLLALTLAVIMAFSLCGFTVMAESATDAPEEDAQLEDAGEAAQEILSGTEGDDSELPTGEIPAVEPEEPVDETPAGEPEEPADETPAVEPEQPTDETPAGEAEQLSDDEDAPVLSYTTLQTTVGDATVLVTGNLPAGIELVVEQVPAEDVQADIDSVDGGEVLYAFDIKLMLDGQEYTIDESVTVTILGIDLAEAEDVKAYHIPDESPVEIADMKSQTDTGIMLTADGFSIYAIVGGLKSTSRYYMKTGETVTLTNCKGNDVKDIVSGTWEIENNSPDVEITSSKMNVSSITVKAKASGKTNVNVNIKCLYTKDNGTQGTNTFKITVNESGKWSYAYYLCQEYMSNDNHGGLLYDDPLSYGFQSRITSITVTDDNGISWTFNWSTESNGEWRMTGSNVSEKTAKKQPVFSAGTVYTGTCGGDTYKFTLTKVDGWSYIDGAQKKVNLCYYLRFITDYTVNVYLESPSGTLFDGKYFTLDAPPRAGSFTFYYPVGSIDDSEYEDTGLYSEPTQLLAQNYVTALLPGYQLYKATNSVGATVPGITVSLFGGNVLNVYCTLYNYTVEYKWADGTDSDVIAAATLPTDSGSYTVLSAPTASTTAIADVSADGGTYSFNGWGTAVQDDVNHKYVFTGSWTYTASPKYTLTTIYTTNGVEDGRTTQTDLATVPLSPPLGSPATYGGKDYVFSGMTNTGNDYTLTYVRYTYTVAYSWTGAPAGQTIPSDSTEYASETAAQTAVDISFTSSTEVFSTTGKYQFSGWTENTGDGSSYVVSFTGSWTYTAATEDITGTSTSFTVKKQDASGTPLKGATFTLKNSSDVEVIKSSTDSSGNYTDILFDGLTAGTYTLTESAPTGYDGAGPWTVTVATDGSTYVSGPDSNNIIHKVWNWLVSAVSGTSSTNLLSGGVLTVTNSLKTYDVNYQFVTTGVAGAVAAPSGVSVPTKDTGVTHGTTAYAIKDYTGTPSDAGYTFHGWYTNAACTTAAVDPGTNATISGATT
jgi:hypothetical protein